MNIFDFSIKDTKVHAVCVGFLWFDVICGCHSTPALPNGICLFNKYFFYPELNGWMHDSIFRIFTPFLFLWAKVPKFLHVALNMISLHVSFLHVEPNKKKGICCNFNFVLHSQLCTPPTQSGSNHTEICHSNSISGTTLWCVKDFFSSHREFYII